MTRIFSPRIFALVFGLVYTYDIVFNVPLFRYYPLVNQFSMGDIPGNTNGPAMSWYGWMGYAFLAALVLSAVIPKRLGERIPVAVFYVLPFIVFVGGFYREKEWFLN